MCVNLLLFLWDKNLMLDIKKGERALGPDSQGTVCESLAKLSYNVMHFRQKIWPIA